MFSPRKLFSKPLNAALAALLLAVAAPVWADNQAQIEQAVAAYDAGKYEQAFRLFQPIARQGNAQAQYNLGVMYEQGKGMAQNNKQALAWYQKAANQGHIKAQNNLGVMYSQGKGVVPNNQQAFVWYQKAANQGFAGAQYNLAMMYKDGLGVARN